jgi:hypothetical protein
LCELTGESSASTYSVSRDNSDPSRCSDASAILGEGLLLVLEGGMLVGVLGLDCCGDREGLRRTFCESRFEKKVRKVGMGKRSRRDAVVGEDGVWAGHLLTAAKQTDARQHTTADNPPGPTLPDH